MKIGLTGSTGFVGSQLALVLLNQGHELILLGRSDPWKVGSPLRDRVLREDPHSLEIFRSRTQWRLHDLGNPEALSRTLADDSLGSVDAFAHLAAEIRYDQDNPKRVEKVNLISSQVLAQWCESLGIPFLQMSSVVAWGGDWTGVLRSEKDFPESLGINERFIYYKSKHRLHQWLLGRVWKNPVFLVAPGVVHGWGEDRKPTRRHLKLIRESRLGWAPSGSVSIVSLHHVVDLCVAWLNSPSQPGVSQRLAVDQVLSLKSYFEWYSDLCERPRKFSVVPQWLGWCLSFLSRKTQQMGPASLHHHFRSDHDLRSESQKIESIKAAVKESLLA